ncbi:cytochrome P450 [Scleroderma citrinum]
MVDYLIGPAITSNPYHVSVTRTHLTRNVSHYYPDVADEIFTAFNQNLDLKDNEWKNVPAAATMREIICRASNRVFVGLPLCRHSDWIDLNSRFAVDVMKDANFLNMFPKALVPFVANFVTNTANGIERGMKYLDPIIKDRLRFMDEYGKEWSNKPNDLIQWLIDEREEFTTRQLTSRVLTMNFASIHSTANTFTQALYHLAANPHYVQALREEVEAVVEKYGWTKDAITEMRKIDSFLTETQRFEGVLTASVQRKAMKDITLSDGTFIPKGTHVLVPTRAIHRDCSCYDDADVFDPFRFSNLRGVNGENSRLQMTSLTQDYLSFGIGRHACPGRFLAASELKTMLAYIVASYDVKLEDDSSPKNIHWELNVVADPVARVMFRKRTGN